MTNNPFLAIDKRILADSGTCGEAGRNLFALCDRIGPRFAGSEGYRQAADFMLERFKAWKLDNAHLEPFEFTAWRRGEPARLSVEWPRPETSSGRATRSPRSPSARPPIPRDYPCYGLPYGAATGAKGIKARLVDIGGGSPDEMAGKRIKGRFVLTDGSSGHRKEIYARCVEAGATGFILGNRVKGMILGTGSVGDGCDGAIPAVSVAFESAQEIRRLAGDGKARFHVVSAGACEPATTWNVVGELTGTESPDELVIMGGHLDSHDIGPGAFDNAAGAVMVMEAARLLAKQRKHLKRTVRFIGFAGEELGLLGSHYHAKAHAAELHKARFMLNCDTPGLRPPRGLGFHKCPRAEAYVSKLAEQMEAEVLCQNREHCHSDHYPFILQGVPTAGVAGGGSGVPHFAHMAADTPEKIVVDDLRAASAFAARIVLRAASDEAWPRMRRSKAEVKEWRAKGNA